MSKGEISNFKQQQIFSSQYHRSVARRVTLIKQAIATQQKKSMLLMGL